MTIEASLEGQTENQPKQDTIVCMTDTGATTETDLDDSKTKFIANGANDDGAVNVLIKSPEEFGGLSKEELMKFANDPFWIRARLILFIIFWIGWVLMLVVAIVIIVLAPRCPYRPDLKWYQKDLIYEISPRSFSDSNHDGVGDLEGIRKKEGYLESIHVKTLWLHNIFQSKYNDSGYGILNHTVINPMYGTEADLLSTIKRFRKTGRHIILDFILLNTHTDHAWFVQSRQKKGKMSDYYIWADKNLVNNLPPSEKDVWYLDSKRDQYYLAVTDENLPNLNIQNEEVRKELKYYLRFWFDRGVGGFHINDLETTFKEISFNGSLVFERRQVIDLLKELRVIADEFSDKPGRERLLFGTMPVNSNETVEFYGDETEKALHFIGVTNLAESNSPASIQDAINSTSQYLQSYWNGWILSSNKLSRPMSRLHSFDYLKSLLTLQMLLPGTAFCHYGDEIGMRDANLLNITTDGLNSDQPTNKYIKYYQYRAPMSWSSSNEEFSDVTPWLISLNNNSVAAQTAYNNKDLYPPLKAFSDLNLLRSNFSFQWGKFVRSFTNKNIISFLRMAKGFPSFLVVVNLGSHKHTIHFSSFIEDVSLDNAEVVYHSIPEQPKFKVGMTINLNTAPVSLHKHEAIVFKFAK
ncbi:neutral and basic amino acid transport protein rBAT [Octopus bimaculoides]|uniref:Glycosyl hydrolase family 13 catalytic domain-containing protein n=1 Tax=Octopus bimaculoides TaxID=37653 RepID=A0A0L8ICD4_OCTBM|nr:neutral and basic amino acid transport protein rBAT [Octopus bimaculoides]|eukprot:XP_014780453.1 PREDICTED: neutral and basic amino acid transport protein rBAT-like [Octopus bimaculoides]